MTIASRIYNLVAAPRQERAALLTAGDVESWIGSRHGAAAGSSGRKDIYRAVAAWACIRLIADTISDFPVSVTIDDGDGPRPRARKLQVLERPTAFDDMTDFVYASISSMMTHGNVYAVPLKFDTDGRAELVDLLDPATVTMRRNLSDGTVRLHHPRYGELAWDEVFHQRAFVKAGTALGLAPHEYHQAPIRLGLGAEAYGLDFFEGGGQPTGVLTSEQTVDESDAKIVKERYRDAMYRDSGPLVLGRGLSYEATQVDPGDAQALEAQRWAGAQVCRIYGVPPELLSYAESGQNVTYSNLNDRLTGFYRHSIAGWQSRTERWLTQITRPGRHVVVLDPSSMLKADQATRYEAHATALGAAWKRINEVRVEEGYDPLDNPPDEKPEPSTADE